jgi:hypothetical protein
VFDFGNLSTPARTYNFTYLANSNYISRYIRNRLLQATVTPAGGSSTTLVSNTYDNYGCAPLAGLTERLGLHLHDDNYGLGFLLRGNVTNTTSSSGYRCLTYETTGVVAGAMDGSGRYVTATPGASTDYSLPAKLKPS